MSADRSIFFSASGHVVLESGTESLPLPEDAGRVLLPLARAAIAAELGVTSEAPDEHPWLRPHRASFITITAAQGSLRGCIGSLRAHRPLAEDVKANAVAAAFRDPRFKPLAADDLEAISLEVSVLSPLEPLRFADEQEALRMLRPGLDGVVFEYGHHTSTFLPQVWQHMKDAAEFLAQLKYKAGLPPDFWDPAVRLSRYSVRKWREADDS